MSEMKLYKPNTKNCLVNLSCSILKKFNVEPVHETIKDVDDLLKFSNKVVLLLFDGMGKTQIDKHLNEGTFLSCFKLKEIDSVFPPTTVAATNSLLAGKYPIETGWLGWSSYFKKHDRILNMFTGVDSYTFEMVDSNAAPEVVGYKNIVQQIKEKNPHMYCDTFWPGFSPYNGYENLNDYLSAIGNALDKNDSCFIYGYWDNPDHLIHDNGVDSLFVKKCINEINDELEQLCIRHKDTQFLVVADHSLIDVKYINLDNYQDIKDLLIRPFSFEPRCATFFVKDGSHEEFKNLFNKYFGEHFILLSKEDVLQNKIFGEGTPHDFSLDAIGDFTAISIDEYTLLVNYGDGHPPMAAHHAGGTKEESQLYLFAIKLAR